MGEEHSSWENGPKSEVADLAVVKVKFENHGIVHIQVRFVFGVFELSAEHSLQQAPHALAFKAQNSEGNIQSANRRHAKCFKRFQYQSKQTFDGRTS